MHKKSHGCIQNIKKSKRRKSELNDFRVVADADVDEHTEEVDDFFM
jgi:hypothetical protein